MLIELIAQWAEEQDYKTDWGSGVSAFGTFQSLILTRKDGSQHYFTTQSFHFGSQMTKYCGVYVVCSDRIEIIKHRWTDKNDHLQAAHPKFLTRLSDYVTWGEKYIES